jgi:hypothetical protein
MRGIRGAGLRLPLGPCQLSLTPLLAGIWLWGAARSLPKPISLCDRTTCVTCVGHDARCSWRNERQRVEISLVAHASQRGPLRRSDSRRSITAGSEKGMPYRVTIRSKTVGRYAALSRKSAYVRPRSSAGSEAASSPDSQGISSR